MTLDYFPFYYDRWMKSKMRAICSMAERGIYLDLLFRCCSEGSIPLELREISKLAGCSFAEIKKAWPLLSRAFQEVDGKYVNAVSLEVREGVMGKRTAGKKGAINRWSAIDVPYGKQIAEPQQEPNSAIELPYGKSMASESRKQKAESRKERESSRASGVMPPLSLAADPDAEFLRVAKLLCETLPAGGDVHRVVTAMRAEFARSASYEGAPLRFAKSIESAAIAWRAAYDDNRELRGKPAQYWLADGTYAQKPPQPRQRVDPGPVYLVEGEAIAD